MNEKKYETNGFSLNLNNKEYKCLQLSKDIFDVFKEHMDGYIGRARKLVYNTALTRLRLVGIFIESILKSEYFTAIYTDKGEFLIAPKLVFESNTNEDVAGGLLDKLKVLPHEGELVSVQDLVDELKIKNKPYKTSTLIIFTNMSIDDLFPVKNKP